MAVLHKIAVLALLFSIISRFHVTCQPEYEVSISFSQSTYEVSERAGSVMPELVLSAAVDCCTTISIWVNVKEITADGTDVDISAMRALIPGGHTSIPLDVMLRDDVVLEASERFSVSIDPLSLPYGVVLGNHPTAEVIIMDDDRTVVSFVETRFDCNEGDGDVTLKFALSQPVPFNGTTVNIAANDDTMTGKCDYLAPSYNVPIPADVDTFSFDFPVIDDDVYEQEESFTLEIISTSHPQIVFNRRMDSARINIADNEKLINVSFTNGSLTVGEEEGSLTVELTLTKPSPCCLQVVVGLQNVSAVGVGVDYGELDMREYVVKFPAGTTCSEFDIPIIDNELSEEDKTFRIVLLSESLPFGTGFGSINSVEVVIEDDDRYLSFSNETYNVYEDEQLCVDLILNKPIDEEIMVELIDESGSATEDEDYEPGPFEVIFAKGETNVSVCIGLENDTKLEGIEYFTLRINGSELPPYIRVIHPNSSRVNILDDEYTIAFTPNVYVISEDDKFFQVNVSISSPLRFDTEVMFNYTNLSASGNESFGILPADKIDLNYGPEFYLAKKNTTFFSIRITIIPDRRLESNELIRIAIIEPAMPDDVDPPEAEVIIVDDDDFYLGFVNRSYSVNDKNIPEVPVIKFLRSPYEYPTRMFPVNVTVIEHDVTATGSNLRNKGDYTYQNYSYSFKDENDTFRLTIDPIDDDLVEPDEEYYLNITFPSKPERVLLSNFEVKVTIYNDDVCLVRIRENNGQDFLHFSKRLATNSSADITRKNDEFIKDKFDKDKVRIDYRPQTDTVELLEIEAEASVDYLLPDDYTKIDVHVPMKLKSRRDNVVARGHKGILTVTFV